MVGILLQLRQVSGSLGERLTERKDETDQGPELTRAVGENRLPVPRPQNERGSLDRLVLSSSRLMNTLQTPLCPTPSPQNPPTDEGLEGCKMRPTGLLWRSNGQPTHTSCRCIDLLWPCSLSLLLLLPPLCEIMERKRTSLPISQREPDLVPVDYY
jgi:hypothetical protein